MQQRLTDYLTDRNLRKTTERYAILDCICGIAGHFEVETLQKLLDEANFHVSRATIYNTIELLVNASLVVRHQFTSQIVQYELKVVAETHHHLVCTHCGAVCEVKGAEVTKLISGKRFPKFSAEYYSLYIYGICSKCKFKQRQKKINK